MDYDDSLYLSTNDFIELFNNQSLFEELLVDSATSPSITHRAGVSTPEAAAVSERGVAFAATGTLLVESLRRALSGCRLLTSNADVYVTNARPLFE
jgi:hypothetical protein